MSAQAAVKLAAGLTKVIAYLRVSTEMQGDSGAGLAAQRTAILAEAERRGWAEQDIIWLEDVASAKNAKRPGLETALAMLKRREASVLVISKMDRLSRSLLDFAGIMELAQKQRWALVALDSPADPTTPAGEAMSSVLMVFSQLERRLIGERTRNAMAEKKAKGAQYGGRRVPRLGRSLGRKSNVPARVRERIQRESDTGKSAYAIAKALNADSVPTAQGGRAWYPATVRKLLTAPPG